MAFPYVEFNSVEDIQRYLKRLFTPEIIRQPHLQIIKEIAHKLVITSNGHTVLLDQLMLSEDLDYKLISKSGKKLTVLEAKESSQLIHNVPLAETLFDIYINQTNEFPYHFTIPRSADNQPICAPFIGSEECSFERNRVNLYLGQHHRNFAFESLIWLRFINYEAKHYDIKKLKTEIDEMELSVELQLGKDQQRKQILFQQKKALRQRFLVNDSISQLSGQALKDEISVNSPNAQDKTRRVGFYSFLAATTVAFIPAIIFLGIVSSPLLLTGPGGVVGYFAIMLAAPLVINGIHVAAAFLFNRRTWQKEETLDQLNKQKKFLKQSEKQDNVISKLNAFQHIYETRLQKLKQLKEKLLYANTEKNKTRLQAPIESQPTFDVASGNSLR